MKRFVASTLAALMLLTVFSSAAIAINENNTTASVVSAVEIRGPVYNGSSLTDILANRPSTSEAVTRCKVDGTKI